MVTPSGPEPKTHAVAVVHGEDVEVTDDGALPRITAEWPGMSELAPGRDDLVPVAPRVRLEDENLHVFAARGEPPAGARPVVQLAEPAATRGQIALALDRWRGESARPARRAPWYDERWLAQTTAWMTDELHLIGRAVVEPPQVLRMWPLSAVVRVVLDDDTRVVVKCSCEHFGAEPAITRTLASLADPRARAAVPVVIATDEARVLLLMRELVDTPSANDDEDERSAVLVGAAAAIAEIQRSSTEVLVGLSRAGAPDRGLAVTLDDFEVILDDGVEIGLLSDGERHELMARRTTIRSAVESLEETGFPRSVTHGDLHEGNVGTVDAGPLRQPVLFDWSDAALGHPALDLAHLTARADASLADRMWRAWAGVWHEHGLAADLAVLRRLAPLADLVYQVVTYERLFRGIEEGSRAGMGGIQARMLRELVLAVDAAEP